MMKRMNNRNNQISGLFIYKDPKRGNVYYDIFTKKGYNLTTSDFESYNKFTVLKLMCVFSVFLFMEIFNMNITSSILIAFFLFICVEIIFRKTFLGKLPKINNYKPMKKDRIYVNFAKSMSKSKLIFTSILALALSVLIFIYAYTEGYQGINFIFSLLLVLIMFILGIIGFLAVFYKEK